MRPVILMLAAFAAACASSRTDRPAEAAGAGAGADHPAWEAYVGEYVRSGRSLMVLERADTLRLRVDSLPELTLAVGRVDTLRDLGAGGAVWVAVRDSAGAITGLADASGTWGRRDPGQPVFRIVPRRPVAELLREADTATPPHQPSGLLPPDLVDVQALDSTIHLDVRYASTNNFLGTPVYASARAYLQRPAAEALVRAHRALAGRGYGFLIHDAYRPWRVTWVFWEATPDSLRQFVANPADGSRHNRGAAVDVTLYDRATGRPIEMPSGYDEFSRRAYPDYPGGTSLQRRHREILRTALEREGFTVYQYEWWHFDFKGWERYPILNVPFEAIRTQ